MAVWMTKGCRQLLTYEMQQFALDCMHKVCDELNTYVYTLHICAEYVSIRVSIPPEYAPATRLRHIKNRVAGMLKAKYPELKKRTSSLWQNHLYISTRYRADQDSLGQLIRHAFHSQTGSPYGWTRVER